MFEIMYHTAHFYMLFTSYFLHKWCFMKRAGRKLGSNVSYSEAGSQNKSGTFQVSGAVSKNEDFKFVVSRHFWQLFHCSWP